MLIKVVAVVCLVLGLLFRRHELSIGTEPLSSPTAWVDGPRLRSNGTHEFRNTVILISIDGFREDYLKRGLTPHLQGIGKKGLRAKTMRPIFPSQTFPNHWTMLTGLYAESHGIVSNNFWDPSRKEKFDYKGPVAANPAWWLGEPMWETAQKAGIKTANLMWSGPPITTSGASNTYDVPFHPKGKLAEKLDKVLQWIDLPIDERPQLIMVYEPSVDAAGHDFGPVDPHVDESLSNVDKFVRDLRLALESRHLSDIVDIIFVSDHGMSDTIDPKLIYVDDILGHDAFAKVSHKDGAPSMGLRFDATDAEVHEFYLKLDAASSAGEAGFNVYSPETMPSRYHLTRSERIAPIYIVPNEGYALTDRIHDGSDHMHGTHGYDNTLTSMQAIFITHGPFSNAVKMSEHLRWLPAFLPQFWRDVTASWCAAHSETVIDTFENVELYNLVMKLLGIEGQAAPTNGTQGFWDKYL